MAKPSVIPAGCWPARMPPEIAAGYVGERSADAFLRLVGKEYPSPAVDTGFGKGRRRLWLKTDLDRCLGLIADNDVDPPEVE
jgi:hypothetical protein